jgi:hypothetical protein
MTREAVGRVVIDGHLAVECQDLALGGEHQRVDLDQGRVLGDEHLPELGDGHRRGVEDLGGQVALLGDRASEREVDTRDPSRGGRNVVLGVQLFGLIFV